ncbi:MAG: hypothetical protein EXR47_00540 [Dehalococcoidia bacterium]|nr:hypothetical protein [Dehalococcoidia bacterium]
MDRYFHVWIPVAAFLGVGLLLGGIGGLLTALNGATESTTPVIAAGLVILVAVPLAGALYLKMAGSPS